MTAGRYRRSFCRPTNKTAHDEKEWTVASQITVISAFILSLLSALYMRTVVSMLIAITLLATLLLILTATKRRKQAVCLVPACKADPKPHMKSSRPEHSGRLHPVHPFNACRLSAASTPPAPLSSPRSAPPAFPHIPRAYAHTHSARASCRRSMSGSSGLQRGGR